MTFEHRNYAILTFQYSFLLIAIKIKDENNVFFFFVCFPFNTSIGDALGEMVL